MCMSLVSRAHSELLSKTAKTIYTPSCVFSLQYSQFAQTLQIYKIFFFIMVVVCLTCIETIWVPEFLLFFFTEFQLKYFLFASRAPSFL